MNAMRPIRRSLVVASVALATVLCPVLSSIALAQFGSGVTNTTEDKKVQLVAPSPQAGRNAEAGSIWGMVGGILIAMLILGVALLPAKRGHQD